MFVHIEKQHDIFLSNLRHCSRKSFCCALYYYSFWNITVCCSLKCLIVYRDIQLYYYYLKTVKVPYMYIVELWWWLKTDFIFCVWVHIRFRCRKAKYRAINKWYNLILFGMKKNRFILNNNIIYFISNI